MQVKVLGGGPGKFQTYREPNVGFHRSLIESRPHSLGSRSEVSSTANPTNPSIGPQGHRQASTEDDSRGRLWIGSHTGGVSRADSPTIVRPQFRTYTVRDGLASDSVRSISEDPWGRIHLGTARGVDQLDPKTGRIPHFTTADGLSNNEIESERHLNR
jgi:hypothetical protein